MYIGPWQEYQLGKLLHQQREPLNRHTTLAKAGLALLQPGRNRLSHVGSEPSEKSYYSAPVSIASKSKKAPAKSGKKLETRSRRIPERIDRMRALYGLDTKQMTPSCTPAPGQPSNADGGVVPPSPSLARNNIPCCPPSPPMKDKKVEDLSSVLASSSGWIYDSSGAKYGLDTNGDIIPSERIPNNNIPRCPPSPMKNLKVGIVSGLGSLGWVHDSSSSAGGMPRADDRRRRENTFDNMARDRSSGTSSPSKMAPVCDIMARDRSSGTSSPSKMAPVVMPRRKLFERSASSLDGDVFSSPAKRKSGGREEESLLYHDLMREDRQQLRLSMHGEDNSDHRKQENPHERHAVDDGKVPHRSHQASPSSLGMEGDSLSNFVSPSCSPVLLPRTEGKKKPPRVASPVPTKTQKFSSPGAGPISPFRVSHISSSPSPSSMKCASVTKNSFAAGDDLISWARNLTFEDFAIPGM